MHNLCLICLKPTFSPRSPLRPLKPALPRFPWNTNIMKWRYWFYPPHKLLKMKRRLPTVRPGGPVLPGGPGGPSSPYASKQTLISKPRLSYCIKPQPCISESDTILWLKLWAQRLCVVSVFNLSRKWWWTKDGPDQIDVLNVVTFYLFSFLAVPSWSWLTHRALGGIMTPSGIMEEWERGFSLNQRVKCAGQQREL